MCRLIRTEKLKLHEYKTNDDDDDDQFNDDLNNYKRYLSTPGLL